MRNHTAPENRRLGKHTDMIHFAWQYCLFIVWAVWWGGLCFYAIVVVPIGTEVIGTVEQGFVTQQVTQWHNALSIVFLVCLLVEAYCRSSRTLWTIGAGLLALGLGLVGWHYHLSNMMDFEDQSVPSNFYTEHAIYLWMTATEWGIGLGLPIWLFVQPTVVESISNHHDE